MKIKKLIPSQPTKATGNEPHTTNPQGASCIYKWIGNHNTGETDKGTASYYSIIKRKYCDTCNLWKRKQDNRFNAAEHRRRKKKLNKLKDERLQLYAEENKALRQLIIQLREQIH